MSRLQAGLMAAALAVMAMMPAGAEAACGATLNGAPMPPNVCAAAQQVYGSVTPGHYWMDAGGNWGYVGSPAVRGNLLRDAQGGRSGGGGGGRPWTYRGGGVNAGSDGNCSYFDTPNGSVMTGNCD
jgi:hypothetical protein